MSDQPNTPQGSADRAEELRGLSFEELLDRTAQHRGWMNVVQSEPGLGVPSDFEEAAQIQAEWDRRCAEREAQAAELRERVAELEAASDGEDLGAMCEEKPWVFEPQKASEGRESDGHGRSPSHWMPLPAPPQAASDSEGDGDA